MYFDPLSGFMLVVGLAAAGGLVAYTVLKAPAGSLRGFRKAVPYVLFGLLGLAALTGPQWFQSVVDAVYHATPTAGPAASTAEIAAGQQASGWVPSATVASKFITAAGALILMVVLIWRLQNLTHPGPSNWAKHRYTADFQSLAPIDKFKVYGRMRLQYVLLAIGAMVFAALVV